jgi:hypothetical protein
VTDYMLTVLTAGGAGVDVQVNGAGSILAAIDIAEHETGCRVDHGRGGIGELFDPAIVIDAATGATTRRHANPATRSMEVARPDRSVVLDRGIAAFKESR